jgi:hypothetical protein
MKNMCFFYVLHHSINDIYTRGCFQIGRFRQRSATGRRYVDGGPGHQHQLPARGGEDCQALARTWYINFFILSIG